MISDFRPQAVLCMSSEKMLEINVSLTRHCSFSLRQLGALVYYLIYVNRC